MSMTLAVSRKKRLISVISGIPVFAVYGAEETDEEKRKREEQERSGGSTTTSTESGGEGGEPKEKPTSEGGTPRTEPDRDAEDVETYRRRADAADRAKGELERKYNALVDKEKTELERTSAKLDEAHQTIERITKQRDDAIIRGELLKFPGYSWHDPDAVLQLVDKSAITIDDDGKVTGVKDAVVKLAKDRPYLLQSQPGEGGGATTTTQTKQTAGAGQPASGTNGSNGTTPDDKNEQRSSLAKKYKLRQ